MIDYATELERLARILGISLDETIKDCRRGVYRQPELMGDVWTALDVWVQNYRPQERPPLRNAETPWAELIRTVAAHEITAAFLEAITPAEKNPSAGGI